MKAVWVVVSILTFGDGGQPIELDRNETFHVDKAACSAAGPDTAAADAAITYLRGKPVSVEWFCKKKDMTDDLPDTVIKGHPKNVLPGVSHNANKDSK